MNKIANLKDEINASCRFCLQPDKDRILYYTDNFYVIVSLGPIVEGYLLIVSKSHIGSCLNLPNELLLEFNSLKEKVKRVLLQVYSSCLFFEHGKIGSSLTLENSSKHCYHAHMHCIPVSIDLNGIVKKELTFNSFQSFNDAYVKMHQINHYLYIENHIVNVYQTTKKLRKQYLRYKLAEALGESDKWDWVNNQNWPLIEQTIIKLKPYFNEGYNKE